MKKILLFIFVYGVHNQILAQNTGDKYATYTISRTKNMYTFKSTGKLMINRNENKSLFILSQYNNLSKKITKNEKNTLELNKRKVCFDNYYYLFDFNNKTSECELYDYSCDTKRLISEDIKIPSWKIERYKNKIFGYSVKKATAKINDRIWTVFYSTKIKTSFNPWRFLGLDGLLIFAEDSTKTYSFKIDKFENKETKIPKLPNEKIQSMNYKDYKTLVIAEYWKNIEKEFGNNSLIFNKEDLQKYETLEFIED